MTERMYFCWERSYAGWIPVTYYGEEPGKKMEGKVERSTVYDVPPECIGEDGEPLWRKLKILYPPPPSEFEVVND